MPRYTVMAAQVFLPPGTVIGLCEQQRQQRQANVQALDAPGWFKALRELRFVQGERLHFREVPSSTILQALTPCKEPLGYSALPRHSKATDAFVPLAAQQAYRQARRHEKSALLDQWVKATGWHRKHVIRRLGRQP